MNESTSHRGVRVFVSDGPDRLFRESTQPAARFGSADTPAVTVDIGSRHQIIDGFGASFTDSAAYLMNDVLPAVATERAMRELFSPDSGIGLSLLRNPMGASDYARTIYSYDDQPRGVKDPELTGFRIDHDLESILPLTRRARELNPRLQVFASPWSAPGWMKTTDSMIGGALLPEFSAAYAEYFVRFIQAWNAEGVPISAVTPQNEPLYVPEHYPGMLMTAEDQVAFVRDHLAPAFRRAGLSTKILGYDHNWDRVDYPFSLLDEAAEVFDGIAWHWYDGKAISQSRVSRDYPEKEVHFIEGSGGSWIPEFEPAFSHLMREAIEILRNDSRSVILWNLALDESNGPTVPGFGESTCRGLLRVDQRSCSYELTLDYFGLAHFSRFIRPGARRVDSTQVDRFKTIAARNEDGSVALVVFNDGDHAAPLRVLVREGEEDGKEYARLDLPSRAAATVVFPSHA